jgi:regulator of sigma D
MENLEINNIVKTQQTLDQMAEQNKHIKRNYDNTIEIEEDYLVELLETINNLCEANKVLQDKFELSQKLVSVLQEKLRLF